MSARLLSLSLLATLWLAGCAVAPPQPSDLPSKETTPEQAWNQILQAPEEDLSARQLALLEQWVAQRRWDAVTAYADQVDATKFGPAQKTRLQRIRVRVLLLNGEELAALTALSVLPEDEASLRLRIDSYEQLKDAENSVRTRLRLAAYPGNTGEGYRQYHLAWKTLTSLPRHRLEDWRDRTSDATWRGWLELVLLTRSDGTRLGSPVSALNEWRRQRPEHPAQRWLPELARTLRRLYPALRRLAALIPISGELAPIGMAIRAGMQASIQRQVDTIPELVIYDTGDPERTPYELYQQAVADGAQRIIGPFDKRTVARLARNDDMPVDTITLNYLNDSVEPPEKLYQFGLLPEDEASQAAARALQEGRRSAIVFTPASNWGRRLDRAFTESFEAGGGRIRDRESYFPSTIDHALRIKSILKLSEGESRKQRLENVLGREVVSRVSRRQDVDMIFLAASPNSARLIKPQFDFYYASDLPLYATSHIYTGLPSPLQDKDLEGVLFCDIPLVLSERARAALGSGIADQAYPRFAALGADAWLLAMNLDFLKQYPESSLTGWTGGLSLRDQRRIFRSLEWARFKDGQVVLAPEPQGGDIAPRYRTQN